MRCLSCNKQLNDSEATRKYATTGEFLDLCDGCFRHVASEIPTVDGHGDEEVNSEYGSYDSEDWED